MNDIIDKDAKLFFHQEGSSPLDKSFYSVEGVWVEDMTGHRFMDFQGNTCHNIGYKHPRLIEGLKAQLDQLPFTPRRFTNAPAVELAGKLVDIWPYGDARVLYGLSGADAVEMALKLAYINTGCKKTMALVDSWHGAALGAIWVGGRASERTGFPEFEGCHHVPVFWPATDQGNEETAAEISLRAIKENFDKIGGFACIIAEPIRSTPHIPPEWYWPEVKKLCQQHGALLIFDEIPTGLGKTGKLFSSQHFEVQPDITVIGKSLGGAVVPLSAIIARESLNTAAPWAIGHYTHQKNPFLCRAGSIVLDIIQEENLVTRAADLGKYALQQLTDVAANSNVFGKARGIGLLMAIEFLFPEHAHLLQQTCFNKGLNAGISEGRFLSLSPPLTIERSDLNLAFSIIEEAASEIQASL